MANFRDDDHMQRFKTPRGDLYTLVEKLNEQDPKQMVQNDKNQEDSVYVENIDYEIYDTLTTATQNDVIDPPEELYACVSNNKETDIDERTKTKVDSNYSTVYVKDNYKDDDLFYAAVDIKDILPNNKEFQSVEDDRPQLPPRPSEFLLDKSKQKNKILGNLKKIQNKATDKCHDIASSETVKKCINSVKTEHKLVKNWFSNKYDEYHVKYHSKLECVKMVKVRHQTTKIWVNDRELRFQDRVTMPLMHKKHRQQTSFKKKAKTLPSRSSVLQKNYDINEKDGKAKIKNTISSTKIQDSDKSSDSTSVLTNDTLKDLRNKLKKTNINISN